MRQIALKLFGNPFSSGKESQRQYRWLPWGISALAIGYVIYRIAGEESAVWTSIWPPSPGMLGAIALALVLMPLNWLLESEKWRLMIRSWYPDVGLRQAFQAVLVGLSTGIFTPNRLGEYPGRIMTLSPGSRWEAAAAMLLDRILQMVVTCWLGVLSLWLIASIVPDTWVGILNGSLPLVSVAALALPFLVVLGLKILASAGDKKPVLKRIGQAADSIPVHQLVAVFVLSLIRNLVFTAQYCILLYACGLEANLSLLLPLIWAIFLLKSLAPAWTITELGIRETLAITILGFIGADPAVAFSATFLLYLMNLILPALIGLRWVHRISWS